MKVDKKFIKKIANTFSSIDPYLLKEALSDNLDNVPNSFFLKSASREYPIGTAAHAYVSYLGAVCCGDKESATKIASILEDIYNISPPAETPKTKSKGSVKTASEYIKFLPREEKYKEKLASLSDSYVSGNTAKQLMEMRSTFYKMNHNEPDQKIINAYSKIASIVNEYDVSGKKMSKYELAKIASAVESIDKEIGADRYYGKYIMDPIDLVNSFTKESDEKYIKIGSVKIASDKVANTVKREHLDTIFDNNTINYIFDKSGKINVERFDRLIKSADDNTIKKIRKIFNILNLS